jgi:protocatechuate 3,4-dioxygenase beta subunit
MSVDDDRQVGRILSRREVLASLSAAGVAAVFPYAPRGARVSGFVLPSGLPLPACIVRPAQTEGPYFVDEKLERSDIRSDPRNGAVSEGALLRLAFRVSRLDGASCAPLRGALVDVWQCDALGVYSDVKDTEGRFDTRGQKFLRGHQVTNAEGVAEFRTVYPGWYEGRTVHIHFKIRTDPAAQRGTEFTSQIYFDDAVTDGVMALAPYASKGKRSSRNEDDGIFRRGGRDLMLEVVREGAAYSGTFDIGLQIG